MLYLLVIATHPSSLSNRVYCPWSLHINLSIPFKTLFSRWIRGGRRQLKRPTKSTGRVQRPKRQSKTFKLRYGINVLWISFI